MTMPKAYEPQQGQQYQILLWDSCNREYEHCDYAEDKEEKNFLLSEYSLAYGNGYKFKTILLPKKYHKKVS